MFDLGWSELLIIGVVALIVVGPRDLPLLFRRLGQFTGKAKAMAREFTSAMDQAADDAGVKEMRKDIRDLTNPRKMGMDAVKNATADLEKWDPRHGEGGTRGPSRAARTTHQTPKPDGAAATKPDAAAKPATKPAPEASDASDDATQ